MRGSEGCLNVWDHPELTGPSGIRHEEYSDVPRSKRYQGMARGVEVLDS